MEVYRMRVGNISTKKAAMGPYTIVTKMAGARMDADGAAVYTLSYQNGFAPDCRSSRNRYQNTMVGICNCVYTYCYWPVHIWLVCMERRV